MISPFYRRLLVACSIGFVSLALAGMARAGSATWNANPDSSDWNTAQNWTPETIPNSLTDVATFATSAITDISLTTGSPYNNLATLQFNPGADSYSISSAGAGVGLEFFGDGIVNNSGKTQQLIATNNASLGFFNSSSCGDQTEFSVLGGSVTFDENGTANTAHFTVSDDSGVGGSVSFFRDATAASATFDVGLNGSVFMDDADAPNATINIVGGTLTFLAGVYGGTSVIDCSAGGKIILQTFFNNEGDAGSPQITVHGATSTRRPRSRVDLPGAELGHTSLVLEGGTSAGALGAIAFMAEGATLQHATVTLMAGTSGGEGAVMQFADRSDGGLGSVTVLGNAVLDLSRHRRSIPMKLGSLAGDGSVYLGATNLSIGTNNQSTIFSGVIQDVPGRARGPLNKVGNGTLALNGFNTYSGSTLVSAGTLGGSGSIKGLLTVGTPGAQATVAPAAGTTTTATFTIQRSVTFTSTGTYNCLLAGNGSDATSDQISAGAVTVTNGAQFVLTSQVQGQLNPGMAFTVINNNGNEAISGTFANLADGATINVGGFNFQASYEGGDGNDLTLTVVP